MRLLAWEGPQYQDRVVDESERTGHYDQKIAAVAVAEGGSEAQRESLVTLVRRLTA